MPETDPLRQYGYAVGLALSSRKVPDDWDADHLTPWQMLEATITLLDRLDDATDAYLAARGSEHRAERTMQESLRILLKHDCFWDARPVKTDGKPTDIDALRLDGLTDEEEKAFMEAIDG